MLSNRLTFSIVSLVGLLMVCLCFPVAAQRTVTMNLAAPNGLWSGSGNNGRGEPDSAIPADSFVVYHEAFNGGNAGLDSTSVRATQIEGTARPRDIAIFFEDGGFASFFAAGGTVTLVADAAIAEEQMLEEGDLVISEIMWGTDINDFSRPFDSDPGPSSWIPYYRPFGKAHSHSQWIEIYNTTGREITVEENELYLVFNPFSPEAGTKKADSDVVLDTVSNLYLGKWTMPGKSGVSGQIPTNARGAPESYRQNSPPRSNLVSAYRNIDYAKVRGTHKRGPDNQVDTEANREEQLKGIPDGRLLASWKATPVAGNRNTRRWRIGTPGAEHVPDTAFSFDIPVTSIPSDSVVINEVHNNPNADLDWVELYNAGTEAVGLHGYELTYIHGSDPMATDIKLVGKDKGDDDSKRFPKNEDFKLAPGEYLLIVNRHPRETILANGVNIDEVIAGSDVKAGATHQYIVRDTLVLPNEAMTLILRNNLEKNSRQDGDNTGRNYETSKAPSEAIVDFAGNHGIVVDSSVYNTEFWPFRGWDRQSAARGKDGNNNRFPNSTSKTWSRKRYQANDGHHKDAWQDGGVGAQGGLGYDPGVDLRIAPGTPGYANGGLVDTTVDSQGASTLIGEVSISEIMVDAGPRWNLVQWIELYNSSMTEAINLKEWELEIRNATDDVESYVDSSFVFNDAYILPNQTLLIVSGSGTNDVAANRVYNLYRHHRRELGLTSRRSVLLSPEGFYLKLSHKDPARPRDRGALITVDEVGNVKVDGAARQVMWELPARHPDMRQSLVRQYGSRELYDGTPDAADVGTLMASWKQSDLVGAGISFYGHRDDVSTPGYRLGGPLPVSLSKFRPVRNSETGHVDITWITESELNNAGFNILRSETKTGEYKVINVKGIIAGHGTTSEQHVYTFTDTTAKPNVVYYYQIEDVSTNGLRTPLTTTHLRGHVGAAGKLTITWGDLKLQR